MSLVAIWKFNWQKQTKPPFRGRGHLLVIPGKFSRLERPHKMFFLVWLCVGKGYNRYMYGSEACRTHSDTFIMIVLTLWHITKQLTWCSIISKVPKPLFNSHLPLTIWLDNRSLATSSSLHNEAAGAFCRLQASDCRLNRLFNLSWSRINPSIKVKCKQPKLI